MKRPKIHKKCSADNCIRPATVGELCTRCYNEDYEERKGKRLREREEKTMTEGETKRSIKEPAATKPTAPLSTPKQSSSKEPKVCKRCNKDKSEDKNFSRKKQTCHSCMVTIRKCEKEGRPVPEYKGHGGRVAGTKNKKAMERVATDVPEGHKKTEIIPRNGGSAFVIKTTLDPSMYLNVDFTDYPELKADLEEYARRGFRSPEMQMLSILDWFINDNKS